MKYKDDVLAEFLADYSDCNIFLHNTRERDVALTILNEGFIFENQIVNSADRVNPCEPIEITYFLFQRKEYGIFTIIIAIPKAVYEFYLEYCIVLEAGIEEVLSITEPIPGDNDENIYTISPRHILGYFNTVTGELVMNKLYDRGFNTWLSVTDKDNYKKNSLQWHSKKKAGD